MKEVRLFGYDGFLEALQADLARRDLDCDVVPIGDKSKVFQYKVIIKCGEDVREQVLKAVWEMTES